MAAMSDDELDVAAADDAVPEAPEERLRELLERVLDEFDLDGEVEVSRDEEELRASIEGDDLGVLIGKQGTTIDALQHLAARFCFPGRGERLPVVIDAAGYRERRETALQRAADQAVSDALAYGRPVELEPMSSPERRIVHTYLRDRTDVQTHSEGDEPERRLVVSPVRST
jgi:spoIIIJ-associated protein